MASTDIHVHRNNTQQQRRRDGQGPAPRASWLACRFASLLVAAGALAGLPQPASAVWSGAPTVLETDTTNAASRPQVAIHPNDPAGTAIAVWTQGGEMRAQVWNGSAWSGPVTLEAGTAPADARISWSKLGTPRAVAVWTAAVGGVIELHASTWTAGTWGSVTRLDALPHNADQPQVSMGNFDAMAVWRQSDGTNSNVYARRLNGGTGTWDAAPVLLDNLTGYANVPQVAMDGFGMALAVWEQFDGSADSVYAARWNGAAWSAPTQIDGLAGYIDTPQVAVNYAGQGVAVWQGYGGEYNVYASRWVAGAFTTPVVLDALPGNAGNPQVAIDPSGNIVAVWDQLTGAGYDVYSARWNGSAWSAPAKLNAASSPSPLLPHVAMDAGGNAIVVWSDGSIFASRQSGGAWSAPVALEAAGGPAQYPRVAVNDAGNAIAVWQQAPTAGDPINPYANFYAADIFHAITLTVAPAAGAGNASCTPDPVPDGGSTTCTATANPGYTFTGWSGDCTGATCAPTNVKGPLDITAQFVSNTYPITVTVNPVGAGSASCTPNPVLEGGSAACSAVPAAGYVFTGWSGDCTGANCSLSNVTAARSVTASFAPAPAVTYPVTVTVDPPAGGTAACTPNPIPEAGDATCTATPNAGYVFSGWSGDCSGLDCQLFDVAGARSVTAGFRPTAVDAAGVQPVPALGGWGLGLLSMLMGLFGCALRPRRP